MARRGTFAPLPCASAYCQKNFKKTMKNREKGLDIPLNIRYDNQVRVVEAFLRADTAMNREIAPQGGNFRGVCPIIGRLRRICTLRRSLRHDLVTGRMVSCAGIFHELE